MRVAIVENDKINNVIEAPDLPTAALVYPGFEMFDADETEVGINWLRDGATWVAPPAPEPVPRSLAHLEFIEHAQSAGNITDAELVAAKADPNLAAFWIKFELATSLEKEHPTTLQGLAALVATGYLSEAERDVIMNQWPMI